MKRGFENLLFQFTARYPEWWVVALSLGCWIWLVVEQGKSSLCSCCQQGGVDWFSINIWSRNLLDWLLMIAAMMIPLVIIPMRIAALRSLWCRRHRAIGGFLFGYFGAWMLAGLVCVPILIALRASRVERAYLWAFAFLIAALWQITSWKRLAKLGCHRTIPLAPNTWKADFDCFHFGLIHGRSCVMSCWALMLSPMLISHSPAAMMSTCLVCGYERYRARLEDRNIAKGLVFVAAAILALGVIVP